MTSRGGMEGSKEVQEGGDLCISINDSCAAEINNIAKQIYPNLKIKSEGITHIWGRRDQVLLFQVTTRSFSIECHYQ